MGAAGENSVALAPQVRVLCLQGSRLEPSTELTNTGLLPAVYFDNFDVYTRENSRPYKLDGKAVTHTKARLVTYPVRGLHYGPTLKVVTLDHCQWHWHGAPGRR